MHREPRHSAARCWFFASLLLLVTEGPAIGQTQAAESDRPGDPAAAADAAPSRNVFKLVVGDFKNFFSVDTATTLGFFAVGAIAATPWDRQGVNNGFNIPTTVFESGNLVGQFAFQVTAGFATFGAAKALKKDRAAMAGRDIVRAQIVSQAVVQALKYSVRRERPDGSNRQSFPSGHAASGFATAGVLHRYYGWRVGAPAYALGSYIALARMAWNRHHASDVVMGAGFGLASARSVTVSVAKSRFRIGGRPTAGGASLFMSKIYD